MKRLTQDDRDQWRNIWCILRSIDFREIKDLSLVDWGKFRSDPHGYLVRSGDSRADAIWAAVEKRMKGETDER